MKRRHVPGAALKLIAVFLLLFITACDSGVPANGTPGPASQATHTTAELEATIEALQSAMSTPTAVVEAQAPTTTDVVEAEATSETEAEATPEYTVETEPTAEADVEAQPTIAPAEIPDGKPVELSGHPRLIVRPEDLPRLRSWAVTSNPIYNEAIKPLLDLAMTAMEDGSLATKDDGGYFYNEYPNEMYAEIFAFGSLIAADQAQRDDYAKRARTLLMRVINEANKGYAEGQPYRDPSFPISDRSRWQGESFGLTVDWIYPYLSAEDKATIRKVFLRWCDTIVTTGYRHPEPIGMINDPQLLADKAVRRSAGNNYFNGNMRNLGLMAMSLDKEDDPDGELGKYLNNAIGARLYMSDYLMRNDAAGGMPIEGFEYGGLQQGYILQFLYALYTAGESDTAVWGQQVSIDNPFWDQMISGYLQSFSPAPLETPEFGTVYQASFYGDGEKYLPSPDFMDSFGPLALYSRALGNTKREADLRWIQTNMVTGGAAKLTERARYSYNFFVPILYYMMFDPSAPAPADPRPSQPLNFFAPGTNHLLSRTSWNEDATWFTYNDGWQDIDHQQADGNNFEFYRKGEWLTKERVGYELFMSDYHNTITLENDKPDRWEPGGYLDLAWSRGSQFILVNDGPKMVAQSFGQGYAYATGDSTGQYNSAYESVSGIAHASRSIVWLQPDYVVVYDRAESKAAGRYKRFWLQTPTKAVVAGNLSTMTTEKKQQLFNTTLLPKDAEIAAEDPDQFGKDNTAEYEPMQFRIRVEAPGGPQSTRFLNVLQGADAGASAYKTTLIESTGGSKYEGATAGGVAIMFPVDLYVDFAGLTYTAPAGTTAHMIVGLTPGAGYDAEVTNAGGGVQVSVKPGSAFKADGGGVLVLGTLPK